MIEFLRFACCIVFVGFFLAGASAQEGVNSSRSIQSIPATTSEGFPEYSVHNNAATSVEVTIESTLEQPDGLLKQRALGKYTLAAGQSRTVPAYESASRLQGEIALLRSVITVGDLPPEMLSAIVGTIRPVPRDGDYYLGMNCHLTRYTAAEQWKMLQMMQAAGVHSVVMDESFPAPQKDGSFVVSPRAEQSQLGVEAFGMNSVFALNFFNEPFKHSSAKTAMAYAWAKTIGDHYKGRVFDWIYGNETNSGWSAFGAAADMAAHNQAMALGSLAADPDCRPSTQGIGEADPDYLRELFRNGIGPYTKAVTLHPYCGVPEAGIAKLEANRRIIADFRGNQEIWATEIGFPVDNADTLNATTVQLTLISGFTLDRQADLLARVYLLGRAKRIERVYWYDLYGKNDHEKFWLLDENFKPQPAYETLKFISAYVNGATPLGGTDSTEPVQRQLFRRADGTVFLAAWALRDGVVQDLGLPAGQYTVHDSTGQKVELDLGKPVTLGERPLLIEGLPATTVSFNQLDVLADSLDDRSWDAPMSRWEIDPGATVAVPCVSFNSSPNPIRARAAIVTRMPGWKIELPDPFDVAPGQTVKKQIRLTAPADTIPGVEYRFSFALETVGPRRTGSFEARIWVKGRFPYNPYLAETGKEADYPMRRPVDEAHVGFGRPNLTARRGKVTIDGDLSDWKPEEFFTLDQLGYWKLRDSKYPMRQDWFGRAALRWDDENLYVAYLVLDDDLSELDLTSRDWRDADNVRLFLSAEADPAKRSKTISDRELLLIFTPTRQFHDEPVAVMSAALGGLVRKGFESQVKTASRVWSGGYLIEAAVPFSAINVKPSAGLTLGCNLLSDDSDDGFRKSVALVYLQSFDYWNSPRTLALLHLLPASAP